MPDGDDADAVFWALRAHHGSAPLRLLFGAGWMHFSSIVTVGHVEEAGGLFRLRRRASHASCRVIVAVRWSHGPLHDVLFAGDIVDLVACTPDMQRVTSRYTGLADVLGGPSDPGCAEAPVRVHSTPWGWLSALGQGQNVLQVGSERDTSDWLRRCHPGVIAGSVAHGEALLRKMRRDPHLPPVLVAAV